MTMENNTTTNENPEARGYNGSTEWNWTDEYAQHKHCQKTVCSVYGYSGTGSTQNIFDSLTLANVN